MIFNHDRMNAVLAKAAIEAMLAGRDTKAKARKVGNEVHAVLVDHMDDSTGLAENLQSALAAASASLASLYAVLEVLYDTDHRALLDRAMIIMAGGDSLPAPDDNILFTALLAVRSVMNDDGNPVKEAFDDLEVLRKGGRLNGEAMCPAPVAS
jgi:hypothetical protein